ncbi:MAG: AAA family ATPase, partial [Bacillota bacterium]|nr:AAA family ATPase [Bacillota bacterium]
MKPQILSSITIQQAYQNITQAIQIYFQKDRYGNYQMERRRARPICLMGPSGIGKTEIVRQAAMENNLAFLSYSITHHTRQSIIGLPRLIEGQANGSRCSMTEYTMSEIIAQIYQTMEESGKKEGILFLDEFNCVSESLRPIMLQLLQDKSFGPHPIPDGWMLVLAGNPPEYNHAANDLDAVTADRMRILHIEPDYPAWRDYITKHNVHPLILSYLDNHPEHFYICQRTEK